jgi:protocatechuate 3,4-dioxygenase beta subunit
MRSIVLFLAAVCSAQPAPENSALTGRVVSASTGAPLRKASVWLEPFSPTRGVNGERSVALPPTTTDAEGRFTLDGVPPGSYLLLARRVGYLDQGYGAPAPAIVGPPLTLNAGETMRAVTIRLTPQSLLYGKVVDEDGDPVPGTPVQVLRVSYAGGRRRLVEAAAGTAQDDGSFVIGNLTPGKYYLAATERHVTTYFPGSLTESAATPVEVSAGAEVRDLAIRLRNTRLFSIRGRVAPADRVTLQLGERSFTTGADGRFEFDHLQPGSYEIRTNGVRLLANEQPLVGRAAVEVTDGDLNDLVIRLGEGATVSGLVKGASTGRVFIGEESAGIRRDGTFELSHIVPGIHELAVAGLPEGSYVRAVNFSGLPVEDWSLDLSAGAGGDLLILVSPDAGEISGVAPDAPGALVQIWPAGGATARSVKTDARGEFRVHSLPPGEYYVAAFQDLDDDLAQYAPFRAQFESAAQKVTVAEKGRERVELKVIGREAIAAEAAKLR